MAEAEIATRAAFDIVRYGQVWEDADVLLAGLRIKPGETVVSIASAGDNALALLTADPMRVIALDLSQAQLNCLELRRAAYRALDHGALLELMGSRPSTRRGELLDEVLKAIPERHRAAEFWGARRDDVIAYGLGGTGKFERYFRLFATRVLPLVHGKATVAALLAGKPVEERHRFYARHWDTWRWRLLLAAFFSRRVMGRLGRDQAFFEHVQGSVADHVARKTRHALTEQEPADNPYLAWILTGTHGAALPLALRPEHFATIRDRLDRLELVAAPLETFMRSGEKADAFNLSDVFEYMSEDAFSSTFAGLIEASNPGARLVYWNMMVPRHIPALSQGLATRNSGLEDRLKAIDKAFFYADLVIAERTP